MNWPRTKSSVASLLLVGLLEGCIDLFSTGGDAPRDAGPGPSDAAETDPCVKNPDARACRCANGCDPGPDGSPDGLDASEGEVPGDAGPVLPSPATEQVAQVRAALRSAISFPAPLDSMPIDGAVVSYVKPGAANAAIGNLDGPGFIVQNDDFGPALYFAVDPTSFVEGGVVVGDVLDLVVTEGSTFGSIVHATKAVGQRAGSGGRLPAAQSISELDLAPIVAADWEIETELVSATATIAGGFAPAGAGFSAASITTAGEPVATPEFLLRVPNDWLLTSGVAPGCVVKIKRTPMWRFANRVQLSAWLPEEIEVTCPPLEVVSTYPADTALDVTTLAAMKFTFNQPVDAASLTAQTANGPCSGSVQLSADGFSTCVAFGSANATSDGSRTVATLTPAAPLSPETNYTLRVLAGVAASGGNTLSADKQVSFRTGMKAPSCDGSVVLSQVYGGGGNSGATLPYDFVELHNRGSSAVNISGWSVQYSSAGGTSWAVAPLPDGAIGPGGYYLVRFGVGGISSGTVLDEPDANGTSILLGGTSGKVALVSSTASIGSPLPTGAPLVDLVGYGMASAAEGSPTPLLSSTTAATRAGAGCVDTNDNFADFTAQLPSPRSSKSAALVCACGTGN